MPYRQVGPYPTRGLLLLLTVTVPHLQVAVDRCEWSFSLCVMKRCYLYEACHHKRGAFSRLS